MIIDAFPYNGEDFILELRLRLLWDCVDFFCIVESRETFSGNVKERYLLPDFLSRIPHFQSKIIYGQLDKLVGENAWEREYYQRNSLQALCNSISNDSIFLLSDADEIPDPLALIELPSIFTKNPNSIVHFRQQMSYFRLNYILAHDSSNPLPGENGRLYSWYGTVATHLRLGINPQAIRALRSANYEYQGKMILDNGGWHLSYISNGDRFRQKLMSFAHFQDKEIIEELQRTSLLKADPVEKHLQDRTSHVQQFFFVVEQLASAFPKRFLDVLEKVEQFSPHDHVFLEEDSNLQTLARFLRFKNL
jgi:hypothetical protein